MNRYIEFIWYRSLSEMQADISRAILGVFWWVFEPILYMAVFYVVIGLVLHQHGDNYVSFLLSGLVVWKWFASSINNATSVIERNMALIHQVYMPKVVFPTIAIMTSSIKFIIVFALLMAFLIVTGTLVTYSWLIDLPLLLILQFFFMLGIAMTLAAISPFFPDIKFIVDNGLTVLFFMSGIFFRLESVPHWIRSYFDINPVGALIYNYREILINGKSIDWNSLWVVMITTLCFLFLGSFLLAKYDRVYAKRAYI